MFPNLFDKLAESGWTADDLKKLAGLNLIRVMKEVEAVAESLIDEVPFEKIIPFEELYNAEADQTCRSDFAFTPGMSDHFHVTDLGC